MKVEPLQYAPLINHLSHAAVFGLSLIALVIAFVYWRRSVKEQRPTEMVEKLIFFGMLFYAISEYSDLYTSGLKASLGVHNYFTELALLTGVALLFIAIRRLVTMNR